MKNIAKLIGRFNTISLVILTIIYIGCLVLILIAVNPKYSYEMEPNYEHDINFSEISNSYQIIYRREMEDEKLKETYGIRSTINSRTSIEDNTDSQFTIVSYQSEFIQNDKKETYFNDVTSATTTWARTSSYGEGHEPVAFYGRIKYIDANNETKSKTFKEKMFEKPTSINRYGNGNVISFDDVTFTYQTIATTVDDGYNVSMRIVSSTTAPFHIDLQTWLLDDNNNLLPFVGMYNYNVRNWSVTGEKVISELHAKSIICKAICYYNNQSFELNYKVDFSDMKQTYAEYENIEAKRIDPESHKTINTVVAYILLGLFTAVVLVVILIAVIRTKHKKSENNTSSDMPQNQKNIDNEVNN